VLHSGEYQRFEGKNRRRPQSRISPNGKVYTGGMHTKNREYWGSQSEGSMKKKGAQTGQFETLYISQMKTLKNYTQLLCR
jgi:hypothetical protein